MRSPKTIRAVAYFEALKGSLVLAAAMGFLSLLHRDLRTLALVFVKHSHLNPAAKYPGIFLEAAGRLQDSRLLLLAIGAATYATVRFIEAYGLFRERAWAEVLAAVSGAIYVPFEVRGLAHKLTWHGSALLILNLAVVIIMVRALRKRRAEVPPILQQPVSRPDT